MGNDSKIQLEHTVKSLLRERSMSMRQLATMTGINVGTISKMVTGKQRVNPEYLQRIAEVLTVPVDVLFKAAGFNVGATLGVHDIRRDTSDDMINELLRYFCPETNGFSHSDIKRELDKYEGYAKTVDGQNLIVEKYHEKRNEITGAGTFVDDLDFMYERFVQDSVSKEEKAILGSGLLYFILATDAIPDYVFPIGYIDDALAIQMTQKRLRKLELQTSVPK